MLMPAEVIQHDLVRNGEDPCRRLRIAAKPAGALPDLHHYIVDQLLRRGRFTDQAEEKAEQPALICGVKSFERLAISSRNTTNPEALVLRFQPDILYPSPDHSARLVAVKGRKSSKKD